MIAVLVCMYIHIHILSLYRLKSAKVTDKRVRVMNEIISGMRLIKMYAWEWAFHEYVKKIRMLVSTYIGSLSSIVTGRKAGLLLKLV